MITYGLEAIGNFDLYNKNNPGFEVHNLGGLPIAFCDRLDNVLSKRGHKKKFYWNETDVAETDLNDRSVNGLDDYYADNVDLFLINTHGGHDEKGNINLYYNIKVGEWIASSEKWKLGDKNLKWLMLFACETLDRSNLDGLWKIFHGLHEICGSYGSMRSKGSIGEDLGENLAEDESKTVADAWIDGIGFTFVYFDNHPMVVAAEKRDTVNIDVFKGRVEIDWSHTTMDRDHLKFPVPDIPNSEIGWFSIKWREGAAIQYAVHPRIVSSTRSE